MAVAPQKRVLEQNFQLLTPLKFGSPGFLTLQKMGKMAVAPQKCILEQKKCVLEHNFQILTPSSLGLRFSECQQKRKIGVGHYRKWEKWP